MITTRPATPEDVPAVLPMVRQICELHRQWDPARYTPAGDPADRYEGWLRQRAIDPRSVFHVAQQSNRLVGFIVGTLEKEIPVYSLKEYGFIHDLWIEPDVRGQGAGSQLAQAAIDAFARIGVKQIRLDTASANDAARKLFARYGFRPSTIQMLREMGT